MNRLIGITGFMSSGKTTLSNKLIQLNPNYVYIDVDDFRRKLYSNKEYIKELKEVIIELRKHNRVNSSILNKYIYNDVNIMKKYKSILYKYLFDYISTFNNKTIIIEWALIINDDLIDKFDKVIYLDVSLDVVLKRLKNSNLSKEEISKRIKLQKIDKLDKYKNDNFLIVGEEMQVNEVNNFINKLECKFTLPKSGGKALWEITHNCNYGCSYCMFACDKKKVTGELTTDECFHVIDELVNNGYKHLKITGGEPFLRKDIIEILKYASSKLIVDISTNASLITDDIVSELNKINLKMIHVSLDGNKVEHESVRGLNTYDRTIRGLNALKNSKNKIRIGSVIHLNNQNNLESLINDAINVNANEIIFSIMESIDGNSENLVKSIPNHDLSLKIDELSQKYSDKIIVNYNFKHQTNYVSKCPAGEKFIYINNMGLVGPCTWVYFKNRKCISVKSLRDNTLKDVLNTREINKFMESKNNGVCYGKI